MKPLSEYERDENGHPILPSNYYSEPEPNEVERQLAEMFTEEGFDDELVSRVTGVIVALLEQGEYKDLDRTWHQFNSSRWRAR